MTRTRTRRLTFAGAGGAAALSGLALLVTMAGSPAAPAASKTRTVTVTITRGHTTDARDNGRPVRLVAAALGVPTEVFRQAFSGVDPAGAGREPDPAQVQANKAALLRVLAPYGVTNEALDAASDYYRYNQSAGELWRHRAARATATIRNGKVVAVTLTDNGAGYSSTPRLAVRGYPRARLRATLAFGRDLATNGRVAAVKITHG